MKGYENLKQIEYLFVVDTTFTKTEKGIGKSGSTGNHSTNYPPPKKNGDSHFKDIKEKARVLFYLLSTKDLLSFCCYLRRLSWGGRK